MNGTSGRPLAVTQGQLNSISPFKPVPMGTADEINEVVGLAGILSHLELAHFVAQCCYESAYFRHYVEPEVPGRYEFRVSLGNTSPGDGQRYRGRGAIQLTGKANYKAFTDWLLEKKLPYAVLDPTMHPEAVGEPPLRWLSAAFFWSTHPALQRLALADDATGVTRVITGAAMPGEGQGLTARLHLTDKAIEALG